MQEEQVNLDKLKDNASVGDINAVASLGNLHYEGSHGAPQDYVIAREYYEYGKSLNDAFCTYRYGYMLLHGLGGDKDEAAALQCFIDSCRDDDAEPYFSLGVMYYNGIGCDVDLAKAFECLKRAGELGHGEAIFNIGAMYEKGEGVAQSYELAKDCYDKALAHHVEQAAYNLCVYYVNGYACEVDFSIAYMYIMLAMVIAEDMEHPTYEPIFNNLIDNMTAEQVEEGNKLAAQMWDIMTGNDSQGE